MEKQEEKTGYTPLIGYKGFKANLSCREEIFEVGKVYYKENVEKPKLCSSEGYHFCKELIDVNRFYPFSDETHRYFEIEILGNVTEDKIDKKSITTTFRITKEISRKEINEAVKNHAAAVLKSKLERVYMVDLVKKIQTANPTVIIGGSVGLFFHGITLKRVIHESSEHSRDLDLIMPFYQPLNSSADLTVEESEYDGDERGSGADYEDVLYINGVKADVRIDPKEKFDVINYDGFDFKVNRLENIMFAKFQYAKENKKKKHLEDCYEICGKK